MEVLLGWVVDSSAATRKAVAVVEIGGGGSERERIEVDDDRAQRTDDWIGDRNSGNPGGGVHGRVSSWDSNVDKQVEYWRDEHGTKGYNDCIWKLIVEFVFGMIL